MRKNEKRKKKQRNEKNTDILLWKKLLGIIAVIKAAVKSVWQASFHLWDPKQEWVSSRSDWFLILICWDQFELLSYPSHCFCWNCARRLGPINWVCGPKGGCRLLTAFAISADTVSHAKWNPERSKPDAYKYLDCRPETVRLPHR